MNFGMLVCRNFLCAPGVLSNQVARAVRACSCFTPLALYG